jgi:uncharacterized protein Usg
MIESRTRFLSYSLTTAEITYHLPDYPSVLQHFIWQDHDVLPHFPALRRFLAFWGRNLEGRLHSVKVQASSLAKPAEFRFASDEFVLH